MRLERIFLDRCETQASRPFVIDATGTFSYGAVATHAREIATAIARVARPDARVAVLLPTGEAFVASFFGALLAGCTVVPLDPRLTASELAFLMDHADVSALVTDERVPGLSVRCPVVTTTDRAGTRTVDHAELSGNGGSAAPAVMLPTSGSTSSPRIVELSHANVIVNARAWNARYSTSADDVIATPLSACHSFGMTACLVAALDAGASIATGSDPLPARVAQFATEHRASMFVAASSFYPWLLRSRGTAPDAFAALRLALSGACALPAGTSAAFEEKFGLAIHPTYGLTEASPVVTAAPPQLEPREGTVGTALDGVELRVAEGELQVRGPTVMRSYFRNPAATAAATTGDGWLRTGDAAAIDAEGHVSIHGRLKDLIIRAGDKIYPEEIEDVLLSHPHITDAAVIGAPDDATGEIPIAFVVGEGGSNPAALIAFCRSRLAAFKVPRRIAQVDAIPRNPNGKILRRLLRERTP